MHAFELLHGAHDDPSLPVGMSEQEFYALFKRDPGAILRWLCDRVTAVLNRMVNEGASESDPSERGIKFNDSVTIPMNVPPVLLDRMQRAIDEYVFNPTYCADRDAKIVKRRAARLLGFVTLGMTEDDFHTAVDRNCPKLVQTLMDAAERVDAAKRDAARDGIILPAPKCGLHLSEDVVIPMLGDPSEVAYTQNALGDTVLGDFRAAWHERCVAKGYRN